MHLEYVQCSHMHHSVKESSQPSAAELSRSDCETLILQNQGLSVVRRESHAPNDFHRELLYVKQDDVWPPFFSGPLFLRLAGCSASSGDHRWWLILEQDWFRNTESLKLGAKTLISLVNNCPRLSFEAFTDGSILSPNKSDINDSYAHRI